MNDFITCPECGILYGVPSHWLKQRREDKRNFYCPNGHTAIFRKSTADKLAEELSAEKQRSARLQDEANDAYARAVKAESATKRLKKRTSAGTCPCCNRTFSNMAEHMKHQHPQFVTEGGAKVVPIKRKVY